MPRNREFMRVFKDVGLVEQLGSGMSRILEKYDRSAFDITPNFLVVTFMFNEPINDAVNEVINDVINDVINEKEKLILTFIKENNRITKKELSSQIEVSLATIDRAIKKLRELGIIEITGSNKTGHWVVKK